MNRKGEGQQKLPQEEILAILRAADKIVGRAGRSMLAKILKGSKDKKLLNLGLQEAPVYGFFSDLTLEAITDKIDWMLHHELLRIEMSGKLPMIVFTDSGWEIERAQMTKELLKEWDDWLTQGKAEVDMTYLKDRNRPMILLFLRRIAETGDSKYVPYLRQWAAVDYKKVKAAIEEVIDVLQSGKPASAIEIDGASDLALDPAIEVPELMPERLKCWDCGERFLFEVEEQKFFRSMGYDDLKRCPACRERKQLQRMGIDLDEWDEL